MGFYTNPVSGGGGGQSVLTVSSQTASFTAQANYLYQVNATTAAVTVTLPTSTASQSILIKKTDVSANAVTLSGTINGTAGSTLALTRQNQSKRIYADGTGGWIVIEGDTDLTTLSSSSSNTGYLSAVGTAKMTIGTVAPVAPAVGDIWIDTN